MHRSIMESIAFEYRYYLEGLQEIRSDFLDRSVISISGGAKSQILMQIKADVLGIPFQTLKQKDTALLAAAAIAGYGIGLYSDIPSAIDQMVQYEDTIEPSVEKGRQYKEQYQKYREIVEMTGDIYHKVEI